MFSLPDDIINSTIKLCWWLAQVLANGKKALLPNNNAIDDTHGYSLSCLLMTCRNFVFLLLDDIIPTGINLMELFI